MSADRTLEAVSQDDETSNEERQRKVQRPQPHLRLEDTMVAEERQQLSASSLRLVDRPDDSLPLDPTSSNLDRAVTKSANRRPLGM